MNARKWLRRSVAAILLFAAQGCNDSYTVTTIISTDGSVDRVIEWSKDGGSSRYSTNDLPLPTDSTWQVNWKTSGTKDSGLVFTASKHFTTFEALAAEYVRMNDSTKLKVDVDVQKKFRWFYSYFEYRETYKAFHPLTLVPANEFFSADEISRFMANNISDSLRIRFENWQQRNMFELVYRRLCSAAERLDDPALPVSSLEANKEALYREMTSDKPGKSQSGTTSKGDHGEVEAEAVLREVLQTAAVEKLRAPLARAISDAVNDYEIRNSIAGKYTNSVVMPGVILETNAGDVSGNRVTWTFSEDQLSMMDLAMRVESRVVNVWAIVVTGVVVLGLLALPIGMQYRRS